MRYETLHWRTFNIFARLFGLMALLVGVAFLITAILQCSGAPLATPGVDAFGNFLVSVFALGFGTAFLKVSPYRPDLDREKQNIADSASQKMGWWTGERKKSKPSNSPLG